MNAGRAWRPYRPRGPAVAAAAPADPSLDPRLFDAQMEGPPGGLLKLPVSNGKAQVELFFGGTTGRVFDVALNGVTVLKEFNPAAEGGGGGGGFSRHFDVAVTGGAADADGPGPEGGDAYFAAIRVTDAQGAVTRLVFRPNAFTDRQGDIWQPVKFVDFDFSGALAVALPP